MPEAVQNPTDQRQEQPQQSFLQQMATTGFRLIFIYWLVKWINGGLSNNNAPSVPSESNTPGTPANSYCIWPWGTPIDIHVCINEWSDFCVPESSLVYAKKSTNFGDWSDDSSFIKEYNLTASDSVRNNGTLYAHVHVARLGTKPSKIASNPLDIFYFRHLLTKFHPKKKVVFKKNLFGSSDSNTTEETSKELEVNEDVGKIVSYWHPNMTINIVPEAMGIPMSQMRNLPQFVNLIKSPAGDPYHHYPVVYVNEFWNLAEDMFSFPINETTKILPLRIEISPLSVWKFQMMVQMEESFKMQTDFMGASQNEVDQIKRMLIETNPYLLGLTFAVSLLHSIFDFLAFKNDVQFWRNKKDLEGMSLRAIVLNIVFQAIIFLYLLDNETSWLIIISSGVGLLIEIWKIQKAVKVSIEKKSSFYGLIPYTIIIQDRSPQSELRKETDEYDRIAFKYLGMLCFPLVIGYSIYSLVYEQHKGWYSWLINTAVGFVYTFGFITMTPQLFINYKLKSVAHMPWKTFMYKALNTFIDDLFAFIIKMPTLHRLACFRDDLIFLIYMYQRWIYPVDRKRPNEYGQVMQDEKEGIAEPVNAEIENQEEKKEEDKKND